MSQIHTKNQITKKLLIIGLFLGQLFATPQSIIARDFAEQTAATAIGTTIGCTLGTALGNAMSPKKTNIVTVEHHAGPCYVSSEPVFVTRCSRGTRIKRKLEQELEDLRQQKKALARRVEKLEKELSDLEDDIEDHEKALEGLKKR